MWLRSYSLLSTFALLLALSACTTPPTKEELGKILGAVTGAGIGSIFGQGKGQTATTVLGGIAGYIIGGRVGEQMDQADKERVARFAHQRFDDPRPADRTESWVNPHGARVHTQVRTNPVYADQGRKCRPFTQVTTITVAGKPEVATVTGVACFETTREFPQGIWRVQHPA